MPLLRLNTYHPNCLSSAATGASLNNFLAFGLCLVLLTWSEVILDRQTGSVFVKTSYRVVPGNGKDQARNDKICEYPSFNLGSVQKSKKRRRSNVVVKL